MRGMRTCESIFLIIIVSIASTDMSNRELGALFGCSHIEISNRIIRTRDILKKSQWLKTNIGFEHITREDIIQTHTSHFAEVFYGEQKTRPVVIMDGTTVFHCLFTFLLIDCFDVCAGTYIDVEKSEINQHFQKATYTDHKKKNLVKPMMVVTTDGHILGVFGPYLGRNNDASILNHALATDDGKKFLKLVGPLAVCLLDRGFRDAQETLLKAKMIPILPGFLNGDQFTTETANTTRLLTKIRWIVESVNSRLKRWKYFAATVHNRSLKFLETDLHINHKHISTTIAPKN